MNPQDLFDDGMNMSPIDNRELVPQDIIDIDDIESQAKAEATKLVNKVKKVYFTKEELKNDGYATSVIDRAISSLSLLQKMLLSNNMLQDRLIVNCCLNGENNGLFNSLTRIQDSIMDIQERISEVINELHESLREIKEGDLDDDEVEEDDDSREETESKTAFRGGKDFIKSLRNEED